MPLERIVPLTAKQIWALAEGGQVRIVFEEFEGEIVLKPADKTDANLLVTEGGDEWTGYIAKRRAP